MKFKNSKDAFPAVREKGGFTEPPKPKFTTGWLSRYQKMVTSASTGAVLKS
ncbi:MAG: hypothetical protein PHH14_00775 [Candidatus Margulisbacteria bacterium]|nr:hypothetical protein [Candidatus Margulisiibacteriota bacterium]